MSLFDRAPASPRRRFVTWACAGLALAALSCGGAAQESGAGATTSGTATTGSVSAGASASDFTARDVDGKTVKLSSYLGQKAVLLDFCATWCEPCVAEFPHLRRLYEA